MKKIILILILICGVINKGENQKQPVRGTTYKELKYEHTISRNPMYGLPQVWFW